MISFVTGIAYVAGIAGFAITGCIAAYLGATAVDAGIGIAGGIRNAAVTAGMVAIGAVVTGIAAVARVALAFGLPVFKNTGAALRVTGIVFVAGVIGHTGEAFLVIAIGADITVNPGVAGVALAFVFKAGAMDTGGGVAAYQQALQSIGIISLLTDASRVSRNLLAGAVPGAGDAVTGVFPLNVGAGGDKNKREKYQ